MATEPLVHSGSSANLDWYVERGRPPGYIFVEVLTDSLVKVDGRWRARPTPIYSGTVYQHGKGPIAAFRYAPIRKPPSPLPNRTVTRLMRAALPSSGTA